MHLLSPCNFLVSLREPPIHCICNSAQYHNPALSADVYQANLLMRKLKPNKVDQTDGRFILIVCYH